MKIKLKKDYVIPAGSVFQCIDETKRNFINGNYEKLFAVGNDSTMSVIIDENSLESLPEFFEKIED